MAKTEVLGHMTCPDCGHDAAEIKRQKNGRLYRYCPENNCQFFARNERQEAGMRQHMKPESNGQIEQDTAPKKETTNEPAPVPAPKKDVKPSSLASALQFLGGNA